MFGRRNQLSPAQRVKEFVIPRGGWRRFASYLSFRLRRLPGSPARIAAGFACGAAVSFTPFIGFHFLLAAMLAAMMRGNIVASAFGTVVGNPWTFPLIWIWTYKIGIWMTGSDGGELPTSFSFNYIFSNPLGVLWPMLVGGTLSGILVWLACFFPLRGLVEQYQERRKKRLARRQAKRQARLERKKNGPPKDGGRWRQAIRGKAVRSRVVP